MVAMVNMGFGRVTVGECKCSETGAMGIIYLPLAEARAHDVDCGDVYPPSSSVEETEILAGIYFHNEQVLDQTIELLAEMKAKFKPSTLKAPE